MCRITLVKRYSMPNMDFDQKVVIDTNQHDRVPSPSSGGCRKPLAGEYGVGRQTCYASLKVAGA